MKPLVRPALLLLTALLTAALPARAETGYDGWLRYEKLDAATIRRAYDLQPFDTLVVLGDSPIIKNAEAELQRGLQKMFGFQLPKASSAPPGLSRSRPLIIGTFEQVTANAPGFRRPADVGPEGFWLTNSVTIRGPIHYDSTTVTAPDERGVLYGVFALLRKISLGESLANLDVKESPSAPIRYLNHWDNPGGDIERGYAGRSIFWEGNKITTDLQRVSDYGRLLASIGVNGTSINNVNANTLFITSAMLPEIAKIADALRPWGVRMLVSVNLNSPTAIGGLQTADPTNPQVIAFWQAKVEEIYKLIPDFAGFVIKADSEGQPGPSQYGHTHADAANPIARALKPHGGVVFYRGFVYNNRIAWQDLTQDRAKAALDNFIKLDGTFEDNVAIQIKNGAIDFQVREPPSPLFGALKQTNEVVELQITAEYLGQQHHVVFAVPMWKATLDFDLQVKGAPGTPVKSIVEGKVFGGKHGGFVGVSNVGRDQNWMGHDLEMANLYGFGRLAWNPDLSSDQIADEWTRQTFGTDKEVVATVDNILLKSWKAYEDYTGNLGIGGLTSIAGWSGRGGPGGARGEGPAVQIPGTHFGAGIESSEQNGWGQWHRSNAAQLGLPMVVGSGMNRTMKDGTGYIGQYSAPVAKFFESLGTCPDDLLLFFHHVPYTHVLHSGETVIQHIYDAHYNGAAQAQQFVDDWTKLKGKVDDERFAAVLRRLNFQAGHAVEWRDDVNRWFLNVSGVADAKGRVGVFPGRTAAGAMKLEVYMLADIAPWEAASNGQIARLAPGTKGAASFNFTGAAGRYDLAVQYLDMASGQSKFALLVAGKPVDAWSADYDVAYTTPQDTSTRRLVRGVTLAPGDEIRLEGEAVAAAPRGGGQPVTLTFPAQTTPLLSANTPPLSSDGVAPAPNAGGAARRGNGGRGLTGIPGRGGRGGAGVGEGAVFDFIEITPAR